LTNSVHRVDTATESVNGHNPQQQMIDGLGLELLPDWSDDWLLLDRERWNQIRLHGLETLAGQLLLSRNYLSALEVALAAVAIEPIRESAHRAVIEIHIAEGNLGSALKHYQRYRAMLQREIGASPSHRMDSLVRRLLPD
jgi:DNA-binding SARP family transcriptional activator